jgi:hypothetical protein
MENKIEVGINIPSHNSDKLKAHDPPVRTITLNPGMYNVPAGFVAQRSVTVDQFRKDVKAKASQILEGNKAVIDDIQQKYKDSDGPAWKSLKTAMAKDQELGRAEYEAHEKLGLQEHYYEMAHYHPYDAANNQNITQRKAELDDAKNNYENIKSARRLLRGSYPEIVAVDVYNQDVKGLFSKRIGIQASNEEIGPAMASGFEKIKDDIDKSIDKINNDDVPLETLSYVLDEVRKDPKYSDRQDEINGWIEGEQSKDKWIKIGTSGIATVAGLGSTLFGGLPAFVLAGIGAGAGAGGAIYNLERSGDLFDVSQSQRVGNQLSDASYEEAKSDLVMSGVDLVLSGLDAVAVVKSWKGLSKIPDASKLVEKGEEAAHLSQVEKPVAKSVEELKYPEIEAKNANKAESVANKPENEYDAIRDVDGPKTAQTKIPNRNKLSDLSEAELDQVKKVSTFKPLGVSKKNAKQFLLESEEGKELLRLTKESAGPDASIDEVIDRAIGYVQTGEELPKIQHIDKPLVKIVPKGQGVSDYSPFFTTMDDLKAAQKANRPLSDMFGLPAASDSPAYDVFQIKPKSGATAFESTIAPTQELGGKLTTRGGAKQIIVPNRKQFSSPVRLFSITDNVR